MREAKTKPRKTEAFEFTELHAAMMTLTEELRASRSMFSDPDNPTVTARDVQDLSDAVSELTDEISSLREHARVLRQAVDEIGDELGWAIKNRVMFVEPIEQTARRITSLPLDPAADDFHERVNQLCAEGLPSEGASTKSGGNERRPAIQRTRQEQLW